MSPGTPFVFDIDGTLCFDGRTLAPAIVAALDRCRRDHPVVFASARPIRDLVPVLPEALRELPLIGGNGAFVRVAGEITVTAFDPPLRARLDELIDRRDLEYLVDGPWDYSYAVRGDKDVLRRVDQAGLARRVTRPELERYVKVLLFGVHEELLAELATLPVVTRVHGAEDLVDVSPGRVDKSSAVAALFPGAGYVAFGNDVNDEGLFRAARVAVCVGGADVGRLADRVIGPAEVAATIDALRAPEGHRPG